MTYTPEERQAYICGVLSACLRVKATVDVAAKVCSDLCVEADELEELSHEKPLCGKEKK